MCMKKIIVLLFVLSGYVSTAQKIKLIDSYLKLDDMTTRYVAVLSDNSIWWFMPDQPWKESTTDGLPKNAVIKLLSAYSKMDGSSRYICVLEDNTIWWFIPGESWKKSSVDGLPAGYDILSFEAYDKADGSRYMALLKDNSIWWFSVEKGWNKSSTTGLPEK
jgi:hypothetical protein